MNSAGTPFNWDHVFSGYNTSDWISQLPFKSTPIGVSACSTFSFECSLVSTWSTICWKLATLAVRKRT